MLARSREGYTGIKRCSEAAVCKHCTMTGRPSCGALPSGWAGFVFSLTKNRGNGGRRVYFFREDETREMAPQGAKMHGYAPGSVTPTTELVLSHKHPDDYRQIADTLALIRQTRQAFSSRHRIRDVEGVVHHVVVVGDQLRNGGGFVVGTHGFLFDVTPAERARQDKLTAEIEKITKTRASIEQAKGMMRVTYGTRPHAASPL